MRLEKKAIKRLCKPQPLPAVTYLNICGMSLDILEHLGQCENLRWLIASDNNLQADDGITKLQQLWYLDLSNNQIQNLNSLSRFLALGTLVLTNNYLKWGDLERLSHAHIMSLCLHGNPQLDSDPYYRIHVIDSLPLIWELDGRLVTVTERLHVKQFFIDTQFTDHPVRHKTVKAFQTTSLKNIGTEGIVSKECKYIFSKFPMSEKHTKHTDERRLKYLATMVQNDIFQFIDETNVYTPIQPEFLTGLLKERYKDVEGCNMVLLLLVISLEFQLPIALVRAALVSAQLDMIGCISTMSLFRLRRDHRCRAVSILLNAAKVDRDNNVKNDGGLYPQLFMCLYYTVAQLTQIRQTSQKNMNKVTSISHNSDYMALMASEAVSLMIRNTKFRTFFNTEPGVVELATAATGSVDVILDAKNKLLEVEHAMSPDDEGESVNRLILNAIEKRLSRINIKMSDIPVGDRYLALSDSLPIKPLHSVIWASSFLTKGEQVPRTEPPILNPSREAQKPKKIRPKIGESILLGPQVLGELTMLMEGGVAMARMDAVPVSNGAVVSKLKSSDAHFTFVDMKSMCYDKEIGMWRPLKTAGDKYSIHSIEEADNCQNALKKVDYAAATLISKPVDKTVSRHSKDDIKASATNSLNRALSTLMVKRNWSSDVDMNSSNPGRAWSANDANNSRQTFITQSENEYGDSNPIRHKSRGIISAPSYYQRKKRVGSAMSSCSLHQHDNVHCIKGFTPRVDSSRSDSILTTPATSDRQSITTARETSFLEEKFPGEITNFCLKPTLLTPPFGN